MGIGCNVGYLCCGRLWRVSEPCDYVLLLSLPRTAVAKISGVSCSSIPRWIYRRRRYIRELYQRHWQLRGRRRSHGWVMTNPRFCDILVTSLEWLQRQRSSAGLQGVLAYKLFDLWFFLHCAVPGRTDEKFPSTVADFGLWYGLTNLVPLGIVPPSPTATAGIFCTYPQAFLGKSNQFFSEFITSTMLMFVIFALKDESNRGAMGKSGAGPFFRRHSASFGSIF